MALALAGRRRRWILVLAAAGLSGYGAYRVYHHPSVEAKRRKLVNIFSALVSVAEAVSSSSHAVNLLSSDLNNFLRSDSDEIPQSLVQIAKIARSAEFSASISRVSEALTVGIIRGFSSASDLSVAEANTSSSFSDRLLDKLLSTKGSGFTSAVVGSFARNTVLAFYTREEEIVSRAGTVPGWVDLMCSDKCRELIADSIQLFVRAAVTVYLEKTIEFNTYDELFSGLTNPRHEAQVKDILVSLCNGAVETFVKTTHVVLSSSSSTLNSGRVASQISSSQNVLGSSDIEIKDNGGWVDQISSVLAVPRNRKFVVDVTGRVTFESVRSFLKFLMWKLQDAVRKSVDVVNEKVVQRGLEVMRYLSAKTMFTFSLCIALCMRIVAGPRVLLAA
ncbi:Protein PHLOEM PROTEIN 2-LIKE A10 [Platanthera zijinensis]|uniref:Protein PHLOEM PROTEIN 2-LIKE A10 n=1 Tax=Platanthera zijinensis TaxID=2320716 RepID=A0AAP0BEX3_9ASPA